MNKQNPITEKKCIKLKQLLIDSKYTLFEKEASKLEFNELIYFSNYVYENYNNKKDFYENYYAVKLLGEMTYLITTKSVTINIDKNELNKFKKLIFKGLANASEKAFNFGYYNDAERYALAIINYHNVNNDDYLSFLSTLAHCANYQNNPKKELYYCEQMLKIGADNHNVLVNYSYALIRNKKYSEARIELEKCLTLGYKDFNVYNQLARVCIYGFKDFNKAFSYLENIFDMLNEENNLTNRNKFVFFNNYLSTAGLSGDKKLLHQIKDFKNNIQNTSGWYHLAEIYELMNKGVYELNNNNLGNAQKYFKEINDKKREGKAIQVAEFLSRTCTILEEYKKIKKLSDIKVLFEFIKSMEVDELFQDYKYIIENYFYLLNAFILLLEENKQIEELDIRTNKLQEFNYLNLTTSEFIHKSFELIKVIQSYINDYKKFILKDNIKIEYKQKLNDLINLSFDIKNETSFLYSLNKAEDINYTLCDLIVRTIKLMQKNEPTFIKKYKSNNTSGLLEADFRDIAYRTFGLSHDVTISAEALSRGGRTDLQIESQKFGTKTFEFKIWGSNDYKDVVKQIYEYLTDFEDEGFIFMVNKNKKNIDNEYIKNIENMKMGFISDSLERREINDFTFFLSKHIIHTKEKTIYHFIYNLY